MDSSVSDSNVMSGERPAYDGAFGAAHSLELGGALTTVRKVSIGGKVLTGRKVSNRALWGSVTATLIMQMGCSSMQTLSSGILSVDGEVSVAQVDQWIEEGKLSQAQAALQRQTQENPEWKLLQQRQKSLDARINALEKRVLTEASNAQANDGWLKAQSLIQDGRKQIPHSTALKEAETVLDVQMQQEGEALTREMALVKAKYLQSLHPMMVKLNNMDDSGWNHYWRNRSFERQQKQVLKDLLECADYALVAQDLALAENCILYAQRIDPLLQLDEQEALLSTLKASSAHKTSRSSKKRRSTKTLSKASKSTVSNESPKTPAEVLPTEEELAEISRIKFQFQQHFYLNQWNQANQLLQTLEQKAPRDGKLRSWRRELDQQINQAISIGLNEGENFYSQGLLDQALSTWHDLLDLDPENLEVRERIDRTERFIEKLNRLKTQGAS